MDIYFNAQSEHVSLVPLYRLFKQKPVLRIQSQSYCFTSETLDLRVLDTAHIVSPRKPIRQHLCRLCKSGVLEESVWSISTTLDDCGLVTLDRALASGCAVVFGFHSNERATSGDVVRCDQFAGASYVRA